MQAQVKFKGCEGKNRSLSDAKNLCCSCKLQSCTPYECKFSKLASRSDCYLAKVSGHPISRLFDIRNFKEKCMGRQCRQYSDFRYLFLFSFICSVFQIYLQLLVHSLVFSAENILMLTASFVLCAVQISTCC